MIDKKYIGNVAILFTNTAFTHQDKPFDRFSTSKNHISFTKIANSLGLRILFADHKQYSKGMLKESWHYDKGWKIISNQEIDIVYSRFAASMYPKNKKSKLAERFKYNMADEVPVLNHPLLDEFCWDKSIISDLFPQYTPESHLVNTKCGLKRILATMDCEKYILKPRYGTLGKDIFIFDKGELPEKVEMNTLVQEFIDTSKGIKGITNKVHDLRIIVINGKIDHAFVRTPKNGMLTANVSLGAKKEFVNKKKLPQSVRKIVREVDSFMEHFTPRMYSIDFMFDPKQKPYICECNSQPMINKYAYGKYADPEFYVRICKLLKSSIRLKITL